MFANILSDKLVALAAVVGTIIPAIVGALITLLVGYFIAKMFQKMVRALGMRLGLDRRINASSASSYVRRVTDSPSRALGRLAYWVVMFLTISLAATVLGIDGLTRFINTVYAYLPNVLAAALILIAAGIIAGIAAAFAARALQGTTTGKLVAGIAPAFVFSIAGFMVLEQLKIATPIVTITYAAIIGAVALGAALAFGLGGREVASRMLEQAYVTSQEKLPQMRNEVQTARAISSQPAEEEASEPAPGIVPGINALPTFGEQIPEEDTDGL
jgi:hypothetical protein